MRSEVSGSNHGQPLGWGGGGVVSSWFACDRPVIDLSDSSVSSHNTSFSSNFSSISYSSCSSFSHYSSSSTSPSYSHSSSPPLLPPLLLPLLLLLLSSPTLSEGAFPPPAVVCMERREEVLYPYVLSASHFHSVIDTLVLQAEKHPSQPRDLILNNHWSMEEITKLKAMSRSQISVSYWLLTTGQLVGLLPAQRRCAGNLNVLVIATAIHQPPAREYS